MQYGRIQTLSSIIIALTISKLQFSCLCMAYAKKNVSRLSLCLQLKRGIRVHGKRESSTPMQAPQVGALFAGPMPSRPQRGGGGGRSEKCILSFNLLPMVFLDSFLFWTREGVKHHGHIHSPSCNSFALLFPSHAGPLVNGFLVKWYHSIWTFHFPLDSFFMIPKS